MPRRKQTQPMQRKSSDDIKENEDRLSETGDLDDLVDRNGGPTDTPAESGECAQARSSCHDFCPADGLEDELDASERTFPDAHPDLEAVVAASERQSSPGDGSVESGSDHSHLPPSLKAELYLDPESPMCCSSPYPVQQNAYPGCFLETLAETGRMEVENEKENARLKNSNRKVKMEKLGKTQDHEEYDSIDQTLGGDIHGKTTVGLLASGSDSGGEYTSPCLNLPGRASYAKDPTSKSANRIAETCTVSSFPTVSSENPVISSSRHQSSVKQLESFVASVECRNDPGRSGSGSGSTAPGVDRKLPSAASTSDRGVGIAQMPVATAAAALQSRKSKTSRLKTANNLLPLTKQASRGVVDSMGGPFAPVPQKSDPNQPLDLSVKTKRREVSASENKYLSYPCIQDVSPFGSLGTSGSSSLADLEKKFGNTSAIFDRIGTKSWASPFCGALVSRIGMNLYNNTKLHHGGGPFGDPAAAAAAATTAGAFGINMIPVPVQRFNSAAHQPAPPPKQPDVPAGVKPDQGDSCAANDLELSSHEPPRSAAALPDSRFQWHAPKQNSTTTTTGGPTADPQRKHTNFQCSCGAELETLYQLTMHLQQTGHAPNKMKSVGRQEYSKLVRGQDMWLNHGCEQTRQILRCMECDESFKSLPELTVHMIQTKHYANIVGTDALQKKPLPPSSSKSCETRSISSSEEDDEAGGGGGVHCPVCFEAFDDPETLGIHIVETGHYKRRRTPERRVDGTAPVVKDLGGGQWGRGWRNSSGSLTPVRQSPPQSGVEDNAESPDVATGKSENDRKRNHSLSECSLVDDYKETTELMNQGGVGVGDALRYSDSEDAPVKYKRFDEKGSSSSFIRSKTPSFDLQINMNLDRSRSQACDEDSLSEEANLKSPGFRPHLSGGRTDQDRSFGRLEEDRAEPPGLNSSAFQVENFFRPPSGSSSDGSAIRAMETFIKKSFGPSEANHRLPPALSSMGSTTSLVESLMTRFGCYAESLGQPAAAARQESRVSDALENSKNLYQNKYLPPVYTAPASTDDRSQCGGGGGEMVLPAGGQFLPLERKIKTETSDVTTKRDPDQFGSQDSEIPTAAESEGTLRELERSAGNTEKARKANRRKQSQRQDETPSPEYYAKSGTDSMKRDKYMSSSVKSNNRPAELKSLERIMKGELKELEADERPSSTSINDLPESSALESLQGLVYGKTLNTEHPLDSLQRLIYGRGSSAVAGVQVGRVGPPGHHPPLNGSNGGSHAAVIMKGSEALHHPLPPGTLILVNPIVTVVPGASGGNPSLNITIPGGCESSPRPGGGGDCGGKPSDQGGAGRRNRSPTVDDRENSLRVYRCRGCRRKFSSKGSYRYHLSRCHVLTSSLSSSSSSLVGPEKCPSVRKGPYACVPLDATAKFNKYYQLASELGTEAK